MIVCVSQTTAIGRRVRRVRALPAYPDRSSFENRLHPRGWTGTPHGRFVHAIPGLRR